jgi:hypothetical protein
MSFFSPFDVVSSKPAKEKTFFLRLTKAFTSQPIDARLLWILRSHRHDVFPLTCTARGLVYAPPLGTFSHQHTT